MAAGRVAGESVMVGAVTVIVYACEPAKVFASVAVMVKVDEPAAVGVPAMVSPVSVRPAGKVPAVTV